MFERRLKIILWSLLLATAALIARAGQIQLMQRSYWSAEANDLLAQHILIETTRGKIFDRKDRVIAEDVPCIDACVAYPAITEDWANNGKWLKNQAMAALERRDGQFFNKAKLSEQKRMLAEESVRIQAQVHAMWHILAVAGETTDEQLDDLRAAIVKRVESRRQFVMVQDYRKALARQSAAKPSWYERWWPSAGLSDDQPIDDTVEVAEEAEAHVILPALTTEAYDALARQSEDLPGLVLRPGHQRFYPYNDAACQIIGTLSQAGGKAVGGASAPDPNAGDELRKYWPNDPAGASGIEALCESTLRGTRGEQMRTSPDTSWQPLADPKPGRDVTLSIDIELEKDCQAAMAKPRTFVVPKLEGDVIQHRKNQPGAIVVIDLETNKPLALVSYPTYDLNTYRQQYAILRQDQINDPLLDRALAAAHEPGSTVKPLMALGALTDGIITPTSTFPCDGYFYMDGHRMEVGRCWTMSEFKGTHMEHPSSDPMPSINMTVVDAIERSCNVYFETVADQMRMPRQRYWYDRFGLGRRTGIGLPETPGTIPNPDHVLKVELRMKSWFTGIGQGEIAVTPLQMANAVATIARGGVWMQPKLVDDDSPQASVNLGFSATDLAAVKEGMYAVANKLGGTGNIHSPILEAANIHIAAKSGTPQVSPLSYPVFDAHGKFIRNQKVDPDDPAVADWYISDDADHKHYAHNWYIGYAPADHPKIAFAVFAEYGGSGSATAATIAADVLAACAKRGYLK